MYGLRKLIYPLVVTMGLLAGLVPSIAATSASFTGICRMTGPVTHDPPMTGPPQPVLMTATFGGTCDGVLTAGGADRRIEAAPAEYLSRATGSLGCLGGHVSGDGRLTIDGVTIAFSMTEARGAGAATVVVRGNEGGVGWSRAVTTDDPAALAAACRAGGVREVNVAYDLTAAGLAGHAGDVAANGAFSAPFREDGFALGDDGCEGEPPAYADSRKHRDCLVTAATQNVLPSGTYLYWNALEGVEKMEGTIVTAGGDSLRDAGSIEMTLDANHPQSSLWVARGTGSFDSPKEPPLLPGSSNANPPGTPANDGSLFCAGQVILPDGRVLAAGGTDYYNEPRLTQNAGIIELEGLKSSRIYDPATGRWTASGHMRHGRWYPSLLTLGDGRVLVAGGVTKLIKPLYPDRLEDSADNVRAIETYDAAGGAWTDEGASAERSLPLYPRLHLLPNGKVFYDAAGQAWNPSGWSAREALWNIAATYDPRTRRWSDLGVPVAAGAAEPGFRGSTFSQMLPLRASEGHRVARFVSAGGVLGTSPGSYVPTSTTRVTEVAIGDDGSETMRTHAAGPLSRPRWFGTAVTLPTGQVVVFSGADTDEVLGPGHESPIRRAEMFTPRYAADGAFAGGSWEPLATAERRRTYHNTAVLMPDGRVLVGGHAPLPNSGGRVQSDPNPAPGVRESSSNHADASFEIFSPPYLFSGVARPAIGDVRALFIRGATIEVPTTHSSEIRSVVLVRNPSVTHLVDGDQRVVEMPIESSDSASVRVEVPAAPGVLPPGPYLLFVNRDDGMGGLVPSEGMQVFVQSAPAVGRARPPAVATPRPGRGDPPPAVAPAKSVPAQAARPERSPYPPSHKPARDEHAYAVAPVAVSSMDATTPRAVAAAAATVTAAALLVLRRRRRSHINPRGANR